MMHSALVEARHVGDWITEQARDGAKVWVGAADDARSLRVLGSTYDGWTLEIEGDEFLDHGGADPTNPERRRILLDDGWQAVPVPAPWMFGRFSHDVDGMWVDFLGDIVQRVVIEVFGYDQHDGVRVGTSRPAHRRRREHS